MTQPPVLTAEEWVLLQELLDHERVKLLTEIRRTDTHTFRDELRARLAMVERVIERTAAAMQPAA